MIIKINDERRYEQPTLYTSYLEENKSITLEFEFPEYLEKYNKKLNFLLYDGTTVCKLFNDINSNKFTFTRDLLKFNKLQMAIEFFDTEENLIYRTSILTIRISDSIICDDDISEDDPKVVILDTLIQKVTELDSTLTENESVRAENESERETNENVRISNENTRISNENKRSEEENNRISAESTRVSNEKNRVESENQRITQEETRQSNESTRISNEEIREQNETQRIANEKIRQENANQLSTTIEKKMNKTTEKISLIEVSSESGAKGIDGNIVENPANTFKTFKVEGIDEVYVNGRNHFPNEPLVIFYDNTNTLISYIDTGENSQTCQDFKVEVPENAVTMIVNGRTEDPAEAIASAYYYKYIDFQDSFNNEIERVLKLIPSRTTEIQEVIDVDDSAESSFNQLKVFGNSRQESTEGYNLFDYLNNIRNTSGNNITVEKDDKMGYIIVNGTPNVNYAIIVSNINITDMIEDGQTYTLKQENANNSSINYIYSQIIIDNKETLQKQYIGTRTTSNQTFTVDKTTYNYYANIQTGTIENTGTLDNFKTRFMIYKGTDDKPFEPYTGGNPSPNPDYPQEIKCIKGNILAIVDDNTQKVNGFPKTGIGIELVFETSKFAISYPKIIRVEKDKKYIIHWNKNEVSAMDLRGQAVTDENDIIIEQPFFNPISEYYEFVPKNDGWFTLSLDKNATNIWIESEDGGIAFKRTGKNLNKYPYFDGDINSGNGLTYTVQEDLGIKIEGTSTGESYYNIHKDYNFKKGTYRASVIGLTDNILLVVVPYLKDGSHLDSLVFDKNNTVKDLILEEDVTLDTYITITKTSVTVNTTLYLQIEKGTVATDYEPYHEDVYILPTQQEMLEGDTFEKVDGNWYEVHNRTFYECTGEENWLKEKISGSEKYRYGFYDYPFGIDRSKYDKSICTHFKNFNQYGDTDNTFGIKYAVIRLNFNPLKIFNTLEEFKNWLLEQKNAGTPVRIYYYLETPTKLPCTPEQVAVLNQLEQFSLSKGINHIFSDDELSPRFQLKYYQDMNILLDKINKNIADVSAQLL